MDREDRQDRDDVRERQRATIGDARRQGIGAPEPGAELPARSYADPTGVTDLGVAEPIVPEPLTGDKPEPAPD